jgi:hypothetical protein
MDFGTAEQLRKSGRTMLGTKRGEAKKVYVMSALDVLTDWGIITEIQKHYGQAYWRLMETAFPSLAIANSTIYGEAVIDAEEMSFEGTMTAQEGAMTEIYIILNGLLLRRYQDAIRACCRAAEECPVTTLVQVYGENTIASAFEALERFHPVASREFEDRAK